MPMPARLSGKQADTQPDCHQLLYGLCALGRMAAPAWPKTRKLEEAKLREAFAPEA
jgi:hypothetical protein